MKIKRTHRGCGGVVKNRRCTKCGKTWNPIKYGFAGDIEEKAEDFDADEYRQRIRERRDIF
jgi:hypothetical protein